LITYIIFIEFNKKQNHQIHHHKFKKDKFQPKFILALKVRLSLVVE